MDTRVFGFNHTNVTHIVVNGMEYEIERGILDEALFDFNILLIAGHPMFVANWYDVSGNEHITPINQVTDLLSKENDRPMVGYAIKEMGGSITSDQS